MATTTPNFGWAVPTSTDLVKDGAVAIETLGDSIDASLVDLKGGTTGQVLAKASNTDMDFSWVAQDDSNAIQNAIVDAKGDLIAASANDTPARLAVGNNGETLVADSSTSTGLRYQSAFNGNAVINGGMDIWQRGTSAAGSYPTYLADRWMNYRAVAGSTYSRQNTSDTTNLPFIQYCQRVSRDSGNTATNLLYISQSLENEQSRMFAGQTVTLSWYARAGANFSAASSNMGYDLAYGTGTNQNLIAGFTGQTNVVTGTKTLTTTWQRFSVTGTVSASATQLGINLYFTPVGTAGAADYMEITGVQLELGSVATTFKRSGGTIQGELAACQRYYFRQSASASNAYAVYGFGSATATTTMDAPIKFAQTMRTAPTAIEYSNLGVSADNATIIAVSSAAFVSGENGTDNAMVRFAATGLTQYRPYGVYSNNSTSAYLGFSAELQGIEMDNVTFIEIESFGITETHAIIDRGNGEFTSMLKSTYEAQQAEQSTPSVIDEAETK